VEANAIAHANAKNCFIVLDVKPNAGTIQGDEARLKQALDAIVDNALSYGGDGVRILIHASGDRGSATLVVSDNGPGMDVPTQTRVLDGFLDKAGGNKGKARTGLGLALARKLVELHGGRLELESKLGEGTTVAIRLPRAVLSG
jgi:signal transduction histidine kinase